MTQPNPMNLQDRIRAVLRKNEIPWHNEIEAAKAILALVEPTVSEQKKGIWVTCEGNNKDFTGCAHWNFDRCDCPCHSPSSGVEPKTYHQGGSSMTIHMDKELKFDEPVGEECLCGKGIMAVQEPAVHTAKHCGPIESFIEIAIKNREREIAEGVDSLVNNNGKHISIESTYDGWRVYNGADDTGTWYKTFAEALNALINKQ